MNTYWLAAFLLLIFSPVIYDFIVIIGRYRAKDIFSLKLLVKRIKLTAFVLFPFLIIFLILTHTNYLDYEKPIPYREIDRITFQNFRGLELFQKSLYGNERFAYIVTTIESEITPTGVSVIAYFHPSRSYVYNTHTSSTELLNHELYHFKITELFARKAKKRILDLNLSSDTEIIRVIEDIRSEERSFQRKYDHDTFHSYVYKEQKKYEKVVDSLIYSLNKFKNPKIPIDVTI